MGDRSSIARKAALPKQQPQEQLFDTHPEVSLDFEIVRQAASQKYTRPFLILDTAIVRDKVRRFRAAMPRVRPHYAVNVTGHGWRKLMRHPAELKYVIRRVPPVPDVLQFLQAQGGMSTRDAYGTLNMGAGFALFVARADVAATTGAARAAGLAAWHAGDVEAGDKCLVIEPLALQYAGSDLHLRA